MWGEVFIGSGKPPAHGATPVEYTLHGIFQKALLSNESVLLHVESCCSLPIGGPVSTLADELLLSLSAWLAAGLG